MRSYSEGERYCWSRHPVTGLTCGRVHAHKGPHRTLIKTGLTPAGAVIAERVEWDSTPRPS